jgi:hypothetical protein
MNKAEFRSMLDALVDGWTKGEYERVASHFADNAFYSDAFTYKFRDRASLLAFFQDDGGEPQSCVFHESIFDEDRQLGVAEFTYQGTYLYHGTVWISIDDEKIVSWREYQHTSEKTREELWN